MVGVEYSKPALKLMGIFLASGLRYTSVQYSVAAVREVLWTTWQFGGAMTCSRNEFAMFQHGIDKHDYALTIFVMPGLAFDSKT